MLQLKKVRCASEQRVASQNRPRQSLECDDVIKTAPRGPVLSSTVSLDRSNGLRHGPSVNSPAPIGTSDRGVG
jgi:hypothetical protein